MHLIAASPATNMFRFKLASVLFGMSAVVLAQQLPFNAASPVISPNLADLLTVVSYSPALSCSQYTPTTSLNCADPFSAQQNPRGSIFYDFCRDNSFISTLLASGESTTLFVPTNSVIQALPRKPSAGPADRSFAIKSRSGEEEDRAYLEKWLLLHMTGDAIDLESESEFEMMSGKKCSLKLATESAGGDFSIQRAFHRMRLMPADIEVIDIIEVSPRR